LHNVLYVRLVSVSRARMNLSYYFIYCHVGELQLYTKCPDSQWNRAQQITYHIHRHLRHTLKFYLAAILWPACRKSPPVPWIIMPEQLYLLQFLHVVIESTRWSFERLCAYELWHIRMRHLRSVVRGVFGPEREDMTVGSRKLHYLFSCLFIIHFLNSYSVHQAYWIQNMSQ
jgi:hypothetical protein